jgi:hypothetical protein
MFPVPRNFQDILADLTRSILRDQPPNIIEYAAIYFETFSKGSQPK